MRVHILDKEALHAVSPAALSAYVRACGWKKGEAYGTHSDIYEATGKPEIILPRTQHLGDYASVVAKLLQILAEVSNLDEITLYRDLVSADRDVVRVRAQSADEDGTLDIDSGVEIVRHTRELLLAAACAVRTPQPLYRAGANKEANDYMRRVRLGQTEHGSFVVTLLAPVPPQLQPTLELQEPIFDSEPMERQVTLRLAQALEASLVATEQANSGEGMNAFEAAVASGVSANMCESLAGLIENTTNLDISVTWARTRPVPQARKLVSFSYDDADILREAARTFRSRAPRPEQTLIGTVQKLKREDDEVEGHITLKALVDEKLQSVGVILDQENYSRAIRAHEAQRLVTAIGDLERVGQRWQLTNARLHQMPDFDAEDETANNDEPASSN